MSQNIQVGEGEVKVAMSSESSGKVTFKELGIQKDQISVDGGFLRLVFDFGQFKEDGFYSVPTIEVAYDKNVAETHWQCDFNGETILDKMDNHGNSTVVLLNRNKMIEQLHHHNNVLVVHGEFPSSVNIDLENSYIHLAK
tara:strand:+ start:168391 stop:168810 length:420 start_codon:yes stop_codon:yes gene_type:complete